MGGYIGAKTGTLVASASDIRGDISATDTTPEITLKNTTETDADGTRSGKITFKGEQSGGEESVLAQIQGSHDGTADDEKGDLIFKTNDGNDALAPTERLRINSAGDVLVSSPDPSLTITNTTHEDSDGGRESTIVFQGEQSGGELSTLAEIEASHDGTADDEKGDLIFKTNDGSDGASPTEAMRIDSAQNVGINIAAPSNDLHILGKNTDTSTGITIQTDDTANAIASLTLMSRKSDNTNETRVLKNSGGDIILGNGTDTFLSIDSFGHITKPKQPAFLALMSSAQNNIGNGSTDVQFNNEIFDQNSDYNTSNYTFTAPVTGRYMLGFNVNYSDWDASGNYVWAQILTSNRLIYVNLQNANTLTADGYYGQGGSVLCDMDANDTAKCQVSPSGFAAQTDIITGDSSQFYGYLVA